MSVIYNGFKNMLECEIFYTGLSVICPKNIFLVMLLICRGKKIAFTFEAIFLVCTKFYTAIFDES